MVFNQINDTLDKMNIPNDLPPIDGVAAGIAVWYLSPPPDRIRNVLIVAGVHFFFHTLIVNRIKRRCAPSNNNNNTDNPPVSKFSRGFLQRRGDVSNDLFEMRSMGNVNDGYF